MKILALILVLVQGFNGATSLKQSKFVIKTVGSLTSIRSPVFREDTSLRRENRLTQLCMFRCTDLMDACTAFTIENFRCVLVGNESIPGEDTALAEAEAWQIYFKGKFQIS